MKLMLLILGAMMMCCAGCEKRVDPLQARNVTADFFVTAAIKSPLVAFQRGVGQFPTTEEGLDALVRCPPGKEALWRGPYIEGKIPLDPWNRRYQYRSPGEHNREGYDVWSLGADGILSTDDIGNWTR